MGSRRTAANTSIATSRRPSLRSARQRIEHVGGEPASLFVDSGAWIALASARDQHHAEADSLFRIAATLRLPLLTTNLVVAEVHRFLLHRAGTAVAARALDRLESSPRLAVEFVRPEHHRAARKWRSEEHTSELQSPDHLVCRLLLEKKKKNRGVLHIIIGLYYM